MLSRLLYRREAEKLLLLMRAIKRGREEEEGGVIIALICGAMWSLLSPGWITKLCMFAEPHVIQVTRGLLPGRNKGEVVLELSEIVTKWFPQHVGAAL